MGQLRNSIFLVDILERKQVFGGSIELQQVFDWPIRKQQVFGWSLKKQHVLLDQLKTADFWWAN